LSGERQSGVEGSKGLRGKEEVGCAGRDPPEADGCTYLVAELIFVEAEAHTILVGSGLGFRPLA